MQSAPLQSTQENDHMQGQRVEWDAQILNPGEYAQLPDGGWYGCTPNDHQANLTGHTVVEHEDGTITVTPSILVFDHHGPLWHGYLERGVWREC